MNLALIQILAAHVSLRSANPQTLGPQMDRRCWRCLTGAGAAALTVLFGLWLLFGTGDAHLVVIVSDALAITVSMSAAATCTIAGLRSSGRLRRGWLLLGAGMLSWAIGELTWAYYEVIAGREVPFPSAADIGYLGMVPLSLLGVATLVTVERTAVRAVLDGLIISGSMLYVSVATVLGPTFETSAQGWQAWLIGLAYPVGDVVIASVVFILLSQAGRARRTPLVLVGVGLLSLAVADSGFAYLIQHDSYHSGHLIDVAWIAGFLLIALGGLWATERTATPSIRPIRMQLALPYIPLTIALATSVAQRVLTGELGAFLYFNGIVVVLLVIVRQLVILRDNQLLTRRLASTIDELRTREEQLHELAFHDPLTGLANRALFQDRMEHAINRPREQLNIGVLYIDLDEFKPVNDNLGHAAGDTLLIAVGQRLLGCVRRGDTVARLGGDEFAVLLEDVATESDAALLAGRIAEKLKTPLMIDEQQVRVSASIGVAVQDARSAHVGELLRDADIAMYGAKLQGKGRYLVFEAQMRTSITGAAAL
jgi:diguanylate cyclase (GGDEF)-like protein